MSAIPVRAAALLLAVLCAAAPPRARPARFLERPQDEGSREWLRVRVRGWLSHGSGKVSSHARAAGVAQPSDEIRAGTTLEFNGVERLLKLYSFEARPLRRLGLEFQYASDESLSGESVERRWLHAPGHEVTATASGRVFRNPDMQDYSSFRSSLRGETRWVSVNAYFRLTDGVAPVFDEKVFDHEFDAFVGYARYHDAMRRQGGFQTLANADFDPTRAAGAFEGLDSTYRMRWDAARFGVRDEVRLPAPRFLSFEGYFVYSPLVYFRGQGFDNVTPGLRSEAPNFIHRGQGHLVELSLAAAVRPHPRLRFEAGYMLWYFTKRRHGTEDVFFADGSIRRGELESFRTQRDGYWLGATLSF